MNDTYETYLEEIKNKPLIKTREHASAYEEQMDIFRGLSEAEQREKIKSFVYEDLKLLTVLNKIFNNENDNIIFSSAKDDNESFLERMFSYEFGIQNELIKYLEYLGFLDIIDKEGM